jgi:hypothetical protein
MATFQPSLDISTAIALFGIGTTVLVVLSVNIILLTALYHKHLFGLRIRVRELEAKLLGSADN